MWCLLTYFLFACVMSMFAVCACAVLLGAVLALTFHEAVHTAGLHHSSRHPDPGYGVCCGGTATAAVI